MRPNPILRQLGLSSQDRVVIFHADDIGMCHASLQAYIDLLDCGLISAASTMVPCSWFSGTASFCRQHEGDERIDMGVHITLTSEWDSYRWRPLSTTDPASGLFDEEGYFYRDEQTVQQCAHADAVAIEMEAQLKHALAAGIDVTHLDSHMGTVFHPRFLDSYVELARQYHIPPLLLRQDEAGLRAMGFDSAIASQLAVKTRELEAQGLLMMDEIYMMPLDHLDHRLQRIKHHLDTIPPGLTYFIVHPAKESAELCAIAPDWDARVADYEVFSSEGLRSYLRNAGIHVVGMRALRDGIRS